MGIFSSWLWYIHDKYRDIWPAKIWLDSDFSSASMHRGTQRHHQGWLIAGNVSSLTKPSRGRENGSTKLIPLPPPPLGPAAPLPYPKTRNLINSANFSIRFQDFQAEKGARKGDGSFFALVTPAHAAPPLTGSQGEGKGAEIIQRN